MIGLPDRTGRIAILALLAIALAGCADPSPVDSLPLTTTATTPIPSRTPPAATSTPPPAILSPTRAPGVPYPDPVLTPGDVLPVTAAEVCTPGYARSVRNVPSSVRQQVLAACHWTAGASSFELDHLIPLALGGSNAPANLWPQPYSDGPGAEAKDRLENRLHSLVCTGRMELAEAQRLIASDWYAAFREHFPQ